MYNNIIIILHKQGGEEAPESTDSYSRGQSLTSQMEDIWPVWIFFQSADILCLFDLPYNICTHN